MKLLVMTQKIDLNDSNLGFFHVWLENLAARVEHLYVVCLQEGKHTLPKNVTVLSLGKEGKEKEATRFGYIKNFYRHIFKLRSEYDAVFVHMNPEYCILGGLFWRLWHKKVLLWYTHKAVNLKLWLAEKFVTKIFTASKESFRLPSKRVEVVGHGIPIDLFKDQQWKPGYGVFGCPSETIFGMTAGRISPTKDLKTFFRAIAELKKNPTLPLFFFHVYGKPINKNDIEYKKEVETLVAKLGLELNINDIKNSYSDMPMIYQAHHILIHTSQTGSMDKVVLEALAAGRIVVTSSEAYAHLADGELKDVIFRFPLGDYQKLAKTIEKIYKDGILQSVPNERAIQYVRTHHNLDTLIGKIIAYLK